MNRIRDYVGFALWFVGIGYMALWPLTAHDDGFAALDLFYLCDPRLFFADLVCASRGALHLSPGLHLLGMVASACVLMGLMLWPVRRWRQKRATVTKRIHPAPTLSIPKRPAPPPPPRRYVKPRTHFGLRGVPH